MAAAMIAVVVVLAYPNLPSLEILTDYRPKIPLRVYTADGHLIGEFGEERRAFVRFEDAPIIMKQAILAAEDERFYQHGGVDALGIVRAAISNILGGGKRQGASTITQQVAKNFFLSSEKTYSRKLYEAPAGLQDRTQSDQGSDFRVIYQPDLPWATCLWVRRSITDIFRQAPEGDHHC